MNKSVGRVLVASIVDDLAAMGVSLGDTVVVRADMGAVGRIRRQDFLDALLMAVGSEGTVVGLAFTEASFIKRANPSAPFTPATPSYAGSLPNTMLAHPEAKRSSHPVCSFVAIGKDARQIVAGHGPDSPSYEPIRRVIAANGKMLLIGCVASSPGFTTTHLAEYDLGLHRRIIMPWLSNVYYIDENGATRLFRLRDGGLCSKSFVKFYSLYVESGILQTGHVGQAYSALVPAAEAYKVDRTKLAKEPRFNVCGDPDCFICNMRRWDRIQHVPLFLIRNSRRIFRRMIRRGESR